MEGVDGSDGVSGSEGVGGSESAGGGKTVVPPFTGAVATEFVLPIVVAGCEKFDGPALFSEVALAWSDWLELVSFLAN